MNRNEIFKSKLIFLALLKATDMELNFFRRDEIKIDIDEFNEAIENHKGTFSQKQKDIKSARERIGLKEARYMSLTNRFTSEVDYYENLLPELIQPLDNLSAFFSQILREMRKGDSNEISIDLDKIESIIKEAGIVE